jgi:flagellar basal-body rod protein FlgF
MENPGYIALSKQTTLQRQMSVIANNLANMNTSGFKAERMVFREYISKPSETETLSFVQDFGLARDFTEGTATLTGNPLDLSISGPGYFALDTQNGDRYTRHGRFQLNETGQLVTGEGDIVLSNNGAPITIPPGSGSLTISADGSITGANGPLGRIGLVEFENERNLKRSENNLYEAKGERARAAENSSMLQGNLEGSNVQPILEMTRMIQVHRSYRSTQNFIKTEHDKILKAINIIGRTQQS